MSIAHHAGSRSQVREGPFVRAADPPTSRRVTREWDYWASAAIFVLCLPVMAAAALLIRLTSRGPAIYPQTRLGRHGRPYIIYKLRSMYHKCEDESGVCWAKKGDARVTPVGRVLRPLHVDELPQLWNVLRGEMRLIGPRPERPEIVAGLKDLVRGYEDRLTVRPGITGLAQILLPADSGIDTVRRKLQLDRLYIARAGLWLDFRILVGTAFHLIGVPAKWIRRSLALPAVARTAPGTCPRCPRCNCER